MQRTHSNIFDWVQKEKKIIAENDTFEKKEEVEVEVESMEVDTMDKQDGLDRVNRLMKAWQASKICNELVKEVADGVERAVACSMVGALVEEVIDTAGSVGSMNIMVQDIVDQGQLIRDQVQQRQDGAG